jgi:anthranilate synthase component 1
MNIVPDRRSFLALAREGNVIPVYTDLMADFETPVSAYAKLKECGPVLPARVGRRRRNPLALQLHRLPTPQDSRLRSGHHRNPLPGQPTQVVKTPPDPLTLLEEEMRGHRPVALPGLPRFTGGAVGFIGYEYVTRIEPTVPGPGRRRAGPTHAVLHVVGFAPDFRPRQADGPPLRERPFAGRCLGRVRRRRQELEELFALLRQPAPWRPLR